MPKVNDPIQPRLLGIAASALYLGATEWFVRTLVWERRVPFCRLGKRLLIDKQDLDAFVTASKAGAR